MERLPAASGIGSVVLEIGGDIGAAIVAAPASLDGTELEIRPHGGSWDGTHVAIRARHLAGGTVHAALFEALTQGAYDVRLRKQCSTETLASFDVEGGRVTTAQLQG